jgi:ankyrin repeat protein
MSLSLLEEYIENGDHLAIDLLLQQNPGLALQKTSHDISPLLLACYYNKPQLIQVLLQHLPSLTVHEAAAAGQESYLQKLLEQQAALLDQISDHGFTPLGMATHFGHEDMVRSLLAMGANPNIPSQNGYNVYPIHAAVSSNFVQIVKMLMEAGALVNVVQTSRVSPLHMAAQNGHIDLIILLLEQGASIEAKTDLGQTPSELARERGFVQIAEILTV